jgi:hypothetical protein
MVAFPVGDWEREIVFILNLVQHQAIAVGQLIFRFFAFLVLTFVFPVLTFVFLVQLFVFPVQLFVFPLLCWLISNYRLRGLAVLNPYPENQIIKPCWV